MTNPYDAYKQRGEQIRNTAWAAYKTRFQGIAADPPQANFQRPAVPTTAGTPVSQGRTALDAAWSVYMANIDALSAYGGALLDAIERYQGADQAGNAEWALRHANTILELLPLEAQLQTAFDASEAALFTVLDSIQANSTQRAFFQSVVDQAAAVVTALVGADLTFNPTVLNNDLDAAALRSTVRAWDRQINSSPQSQLDTPATWKTALTGTGNDIEAFLDSLAGIGPLVTPLVPALETELAGATNDPALDITVTGAPQAGATVTLSVGAITPGTTLGWDLDGDGDTDDATTPTVQWTVPGDAVAGAPLPVTVVANGPDAHDVAYEIIVVAPGGNLPPVIPVVPGANLIEVAPGATANLSVSATDPNGDALQYRWYVEGVEVPGATAATYGFPAPAGITKHFFIEAWVSDGAADTRVSFSVNAATTDADADGFLAAPGPDCDDSVFAIKPGALENTSNGVDDDCDGQVDEPNAPGFVSISSTTSELSEGDLFTQTPVWTHPAKAAGNPGQVFELTYEWGDGDIDSVTFTTASPLPPNPVFSHQYEDDGLSLRRKLCVEWTTDPAPVNEIVCDERVITVGNTIPMVNAADLRTWTKQSGPPDYPGSPLYNGNFVPLDPQGRSVQTFGNPNSDTIMVGPDPLGPTGYGRFSMTHEYLSNADFDQLGAVFGYDGSFDVGNGGPAEGEVWDPNANYVGSSWADVTAGVSYNPRISCNDAPAGGVLTNLRPFTVWQRRGIPTYDEMTFLLTTNYPYDPTDDGTADGGIAQDVRCSDASGVTRLGSVATNLNPFEFPGAARWLRRRIDGNISLVTLSNVSDPYLVEYDYQPDSITVWINGAEHLRIVNPDPVNNPNPPGQAGLYYRSQGDVRMSATRPTPTFAFLEGKGGEFDERDAAGDPVLPDGITIPMHDGADDTHTIRIDWGDGTATTDGAVAPDPTTGNGWFTITGDHVYDEAGTYTGNVCATDDEGLRSCFPFVAEVANQAPKVNAGFDIAVGADVELSDWTFQDPGPLDTHTATIDWGDSSPLDTTPVVDEIRGGGTVTGAHTYTADGTYVVELCVTDLGALHGAETCDTRELDVRVSAVAPIAALVDDDIGVEGSPVTLGIGWSDRNVDETYTVTVDWGDGSPVEMVPVGQAVVGCVDLDPAPAVVDADCALSASSAPTHVYGDNGSYDVSVTVTDGSALDDVASGQITVVNAPPTLTLGTPGVSAKTVSLSGTYTDPGAVDTHRLTVDWGDGTSFDASATGGVADASHTYAATASGVRTIVVCVVDDDGGTGCVTTQANLDTTTPPPTPKVPFLVPLTPARLLDTRNSATIDGNFTNTGPLAGGQSIELKVTGRGGVPTTGVDAAVLNVGALTPTAGGFLTIHPCGTLPNASSLNYTTGVNIPNEVIAKLSPTGTICIYTYATTGLIADVVGYIPTGSDYRSLTPARLLDTRNSATIDGNFTNTGPLAGGQSIELKVTGRGGVPTTGVDAAVLNVGALTPTAGGFLTIHPCGTLPNASSLNYTTGVNIPNEVIAKLSPTGTICIYTYATTGLIADVVGYIPTGSDYQSLTPARLLDTRNSATIDGNFTNTGPLAGGQSIELKVTGRGGVPTTGVDAAVLNVGALAPQRGGFLTIHPCGTLPNASSLNYTTGVNIPNEVIAKLSPTGTICIYTYATTGLIADVVGYIPTT